MAARRELDPTGHDLASSPGVQGALDLTLPGYGFTMGGIMLYSGIKTGNKLEIAIGGVNVALSGYALRNTLLAAWKETDILSPSQHINFIMKNLGVGIRRNIAYAEGKIGGNTIRVVGISGETDRLYVTESPINRQYVTQVVDDFSRAFDSEVKILEDIAARYKSTPNVSGRITLVSERPYCLSCSDVIKQFQKQFPNIKIHQINGVK